MYNIKEIECKGSKGTGISPMQIKDILKLLVDDGLVKCEKCGNSNIYWSFEYTATMQLRNEYSKKCLQRDELSDKIANLRAAAADLKDERKMGPKQRNLLVDKSTKLEADNLQLSNKWKQLLTNSPDQITERKNGLHRVAEVNESILNNIEILIRYISNSISTSLTKDAICEYFGIAEEDL